MRSLLFLFLALSVLPLYLFIYGNYFDGIEVAFAGTHSSRFGSHVGYLSPAYVHRIYSYSPGDFPVWEDPSVPSSAYTKPLPPSDRESENDQEKQISQDYLEAHQRIVLSNQLAQRQQRHQELLDDQRILRMQNREILAGKDPEEVVAENPDSQLARSYSADEVPQDKDSFSQVHYQAAQETSKKPHDDSENMSPDSLGKGNYQSDKEGFYQLFGLEPVKEEDTSNDTASDKRSMRIIETDEQGNPRAVEMPSSATND